MNLLDVAKNAIKIEIESMEQAMSKLDEGFVKAVDLILSCKGRVVVTGMGKSGHIAQKIAATLASTGTPALFLHPAEGVHGDLGMLVLGDVVLAISNSGETEEVKRILPVIKRFAIPLISIVGNRSSVLAKASDAVLDSGVAKEACPMNLAPTSSTTVQLALGDALAVALVEKRGFKEADFALFHPSGALGKKLLLRVEDLWHTGKDVPIITDSASLKDTLYEISSKRFGCTAVVDKVGTLTGIITDGDLRRAMECVDNIGELTVPIMMGQKSPKTIDRNELAATALALMERHSITTLFSVDEKLKPIGILHIHDLLKAGLV